MREVEKNISKNRCLCELTPEQSSYAAEYLNENQNERDEIINEIRAWINSNDDIYSRTDDFFIVRFLRGCKYNIEKTKKKLRNYYLQRSLNPEWFSNRDPFLPELQELLNLGVFLPLRKVDNQGRMIVVIRACVHDPYKHKQADVFKIGMMLLDLATRDHVNSSLYGIVTIHDMLGVQFAHGLQMTPGVIKRLVNTWQGYPNRIRSLDYVNAPAHINIVLNIFKKFMSKKLSERIHVHTGDGKSMLKELSPDVLPKELGGTESDYSTLTNYWKQQAEENKDWFIEDEKYRLKT